MKKAIRKVFGTLAAAGILLASSGFRLSDFSFEQLKHYERPFQGTAFTACRISGSDYGIDKTYEDYKLIDNEWSAQYRYIKNHMTVDPASGFLFDEDGFIAVAMAYNYGEIGSRYYIHLTSGSIIPVIVIDKKARADASNGCTGNDNDDVIEFVIDSDIAENYKDFRSSNGYVSYGNFNNQSYFRGGITKIEKVPPYSETSKYNGWYTIYGKKVYFKNGVRRIGWVKQEDGWYYLDEDGNSMKGWQKIDGKWYYMDSSGLMLTGWQMISGRWYYLNSAGVMQTGWVKTRSGWYYMDTKGLMQTDWKQILGKWYYFSPDSGVMLTGWQQISGEWYYMDSSGAMHTGWQKISGKWYFMNSSGTMLTGWRKLSGKWYYLSPQTGEMKTGWQKISNTWYYMNSSGEMQTGWIKTGSGWYYLDSSGAMRTGWIKSFGRWYYADSSGLMQTGWQTVGDIRYYFDENGAMQTGWKKIEGSWYYFRDDGSMAANETVDGYELTESGKMKE